MTFNSDQCETLFRVSQQVIRTRFAFYDHNAARITERCRRNVCFSEADATPQENEKRSFAVQLLC